MAAASFDVVGIGNAIVDVIAQCDDDFLRREGLTKGAMQLIDAPRAEALYAAMGSGVEMSGGSAGNTIAGIASLGGKAAYIGKVAEDQLGDVYRHDMRSIGVRFDTPALRRGAPTARSLILVTPDAHRTMNTFLGACVELGPEDVDAALIPSAQVTYLEGYLFDPPRAKEAFRKAAALAHAAQRKVSLSLSDSFCVERYRAEFRALIEGHIDILFANESEIGALYQTDFDQALAAIRGKCDIAVLTRSERGSVVVTADTIHPVAADKVERVLDTTGAGDLYASGFLFGFTHGRDLAACARLGSLCAGAILGHYGPRPETSLERLARAKGLL